MDRVDRADVSRRGLVSAIGAVLLAANGGTATGRSATAVSGSESMGAAEPIGQSYVAPSKASLPVPDSTPGVALTDEGIYRYPSDSDRWEAFEELLAHARTSVDRRGGAGVSDDVRVVAPGDDLQSAVDALPEGGRVVVASGHHRVADSITLPSNVSLTGRSFDGAVLVADGLDGPVIESHDEHYGQVRNLKIDGQDGGVDGIHFSNAKSRPSHHLVEDVHVVNCRRGVVFDDVEDSWIRRGRIGGCDTGIRHAVAGGFGSITGTHVVDSRRHSIAADTRMLSLRDAVLGSVDVDHHVDVGPDTQQLILDGCWVENAPPVVDTGRHTLEQLRAHGCRFLIDDDGFRGTFNHVDLGSTTVANASESTVELFGSEPGRVTGANVKLAGAAQWTNRGFSNALSGIQGGDGDGGGLSTSHPVAVQRSFVAEPVEGGAAATTLDLPEEQPDADYGVMISPAWTTSYCVAAKRRDGFDVEFGAAAPDDGSTVDCWVYRSN